jgi:hypothetical protein
MSSSRSSASIADSDQWNWHEHQYTSTGGTTPSDSLSLSLENDSVKTTLSSSCHWSDTSLPATLSDFSFIHTMLRVTLVSPPSCCVSDSMPTSTTTTTTTTTFKPAAAANHSSPSFSSSSSSSSRSCFSCIDVCMTRPMTAVKFRRIMLLCITLCFMFQAVVALMFLSNLHGVLLDGGMSATNALSLIVLYATGNLATSLCGPLVYHALSRMLELDLLSSYIHRLLRLNDRITQQLIRQIKWRGLLCIALCILDCAALVLGALSYGHVTHSVLWSVSLAYISIVSLLILFAEVFFWFVCELVRIQTTVFVHKLTNNEFKTADEALMYHVAMSRAFAPFRHTWQWFIAIAVGSCLVVVIVVCLVLVQGDNSSGILTTKRPLTVLAQLSAYGLSTIWNLYHILQGIGRVNDAYERAVNAIITKQLYTSEKRAALLLQCDEFPVYFSLFGFRLTTGRTIRIAVTVLSALAPFLVHIFTGS